MSELDPNKVYKATTDYGHMTAQYKDGLVTLTLDTNNDGTVDINMTGRYSRTAIPTTVNGMNVNNSSITADALLASQKGFSPDELGNLAPTLIRALRTAQIENGVIPSATPVSR